MGYMLPKAFETLWNVLVTKYPSLFVRSSTLLTFIRKILPQRDSTTEKMLIMAIVIGAAAVVALEAGKKASSNTKQQN